MIFINLDSLDTANSLVKVCDEYQDQYIDVVHGRYIVDGKSLLGICSLMGKIVKIVPIINNEKLLENITEDLKNIGAWVEDNK